MGAPSMGCVGVGVRTLSFSVTWGTPFVVSPGLDDPGGRSVLGEAVALLGWSWVLIGRGGCVVCVSGISSFCRVAVKPDELSALLNRLFR